MKEKPIGIILASALILLSPWIIQASVAVGLSVSVSHLRGALASHLGFGIYFYYSLPFIMGLSVVWVRRFSLQLFYALFFVLSTFTLICMLSSLDLSVKLVLAANWISIAWIGLFFIRSSVRRLYLNQALRWWEHRPRFKVQLSAEVIVEGHDRAFSGIITDLSEGGAFLVIDQELPTGKMLSVKFSTLARSFEIPAEQVYFSNTEKGFGLKFLPKDPEMYLELQALCRGMKKIGLMRRNASPPLKLRVLNWVRDL